MLCEALKVNNGLKTNPKGTTASTKHRGTLHAAKLLLTNFQLSETSFRTADNLAHSSSPTSPTLLPARQSALNRRAKRTRHFVHKIRSRFPCNKLTERKDCFHSIGCIV